MRDADAGNPPAHQSVHALPGDTATLAPAAQHLPPVPDSRIAERLKPFPVAGNRVIVEAALPDRPQPLPRLRNRIVHALPQLLPDFLQFRAHPLAYRLPLHGEAPGCPGPPTPVGESQSIERLTLALPSPLPVAFGESPELHQSGLLRVQFPPVLPQLLWPCPAPERRFPPGLER